MVVVRMTMQSLRRMQQADPERPGVYVDVLLQLMSALPTKQSAVETMAKHGKRHGVTGSIRSLAHFCGCSVAVADDMHKSEHSRSAVDGQDVSWLHTHRSIHRLFETWNAFQVVWHC